MGRAYSHTKWDTLIAAKAVQNGREIQDQDGQMCLLAEVCFDYVFAVCSIMSYMLQFGETLIKERIIILSCSIT